MREQKRKEIRDHWRDGAPTGMCKTIKDLEIFVLREALQRANDKLPAGLQMVLDVGCGEWENVKRLRTDFPKVGWCGVDLVDRSDSTPAGTHFKQCDILDLSHSTFGCDFDVAMSDRCLINLPDPFCQAEGLSRMASTVRPGGFIILIENFALNRYLQDHFRESVGLKARDIPDYNCFLDISLMSTVFQQLGLEIVWSWNFSALHDLALYVLLPAAGVEPAYEHDVVKAASELTMTMSESYREAINDCGQNSVMLLRKKR